MTFDLERRLDEFADGDHDIAGIRQLAIEAADARAEEIAQMFERRPTTMRSGAHAATEARSTIAKPEARAIDLKRRTDGERRAYLQGYSAGMASGLAWEEKP